MISSGCEDIYLGIASNLIKLYFSEDIFIRQGHDELVKLLKKSNNTARILEFLSPKFILKHSSQKSSDSVLEEQIKIGLNEAIKKQSVDDLHNINCCIKSILQLNNSILETDSGWIHYDIDQSLINELKVVPQTD
ncbi:MAG: hypothetical protein IPN18_15770 [Ignavibacteriales bacterium]|nr:hypothetical protein [Ignavibacteriales bacterium]